MEKRTLFWDVDTQYDFLMPDGKLYIKGADQIIPVVSDLRAMTLDNGCSIIASMDWHSVDNPEISDNPDFRSTFPPHCMAGSPGAQRIGYLGKLPVNYIDLKHMNPGRLTELVQKGQFHIAIRKEALSPFSNPNTVTLVEAAAPDSIIVFGVALDFCVCQTLLGLARFPGVQLLLVKDATKAVDAASETRVFDGLQRMGVELTEFSLLEETTPCG